LSGEAVEVSGARVAFRLQVTTAPAAPRVVLNEVLANAAGAEPAQEWIELVNDGAAMVNLEGYQLQDAGGSNVLPAFELGAGEFALLVSDEYLPDPAVDVPPAPGAHLVVLPALGKNGLSNTGELLRLFDAQGLLVSSFPALRSSNAGVSLARRSPSAADDDAAAFGPHAAPGASPGAPNVLSER
ncbi:MAG TPA: lamin tail domain-containing protein, partial [Polyangiaceae bacterium]|nr:lamin tail domain-containing protein [Polyangiaceae bacterium]